LANEGHPCGSPWMLFYGHTIQFLDGELPWTKVLIWLIKRASLRFSLEELLIIEMLIHGGTLDEDNKNSSWLMKIFSLGSPLKGIIDEKKSLWWKVFYGRSIRNWFHERSFHENVINRSFLSWLSESIWISIDTSWWLFIAFFLSWLFESIWISIDTSWWFIALFHSMKMMMFSSSPRKLLVGYSS